MDCKHCHKSWVSFFEDDETCPYCGASLIEKKEKVEPAWPWDQKEQVPEQDAPGETAALPAEDIREAQEEDLYDGDVEEEYEEVPQKQLQEKLQEKLQATPQATPQVTPQEQLHTDDDKERKALATRLAQSLQGFSVAATKRIAETPSHILLNRLASASAQQEQKKPSAGVAKVAAQPAKPTPQAKATEPRGSQYRVVLLSCGSKKLSVIQAYRNRTGADLLPAKRLVETYRAVLFKGLTYQEAAAIKEEFVKLGATVVIELSN